MNIYLVIYLVIGVLIYFINLGYSKYKYHALSIGLVLILFWPIIFAYHLGEGLKK